MSDINSERHSKDEWLRTSPDSPIPPTDRTSFNGLAYYDEDPTLRFEVVPEPADGAEITIQTSDDRERTYARAFTATVEIDGAPTTMALYATPHGLFLPFRDATSGSETYGAGRYIDVPAAADNAPIVIDFNRAYNPFCAYNDRYSCPLPPGENWLEVSVRAGEKAYQRA